MEALTKDTPTEEIYNSLVEVNKEFNSITYNSNPSLYNYLEVKRRNLQDILIIRGVVL